MFQKHSFPTLTERIESWLKIARAAVKREERSENPERIDAENVPRTKSLTALLREEITRSMATPDDERIEAALTRALEQVRKNLSGEGVRLRHAWVWFQHPVEVLTSQIAGMKYRNLELHRNINEDVLCERIAERDPIDDGEIRRRFLLSPVKLRAYLQNVFGDLDESDSEECYADESATSGNTPFADRLERFLYDDFYVLLDTDSKHVIESASRMSLIYDTLTECFHQARAANDAMVQYGSVPSLMHLEQFRDLYDELGGLDGIAAGLALKHRSELFKVLGSRYGILDRVPDNEQVKLPDGGTACVRVHLRTLGRNEIPSAANPMMAQVKERDIYRESKDSIHFDYSSPEALLEDGWVLD